MTTKEVMTTTREETTTWKGNENMATKKEETRSVESESSSSVDISIFDHTPSYCEENVYMLCKKLITMGISEKEGYDLFVVFISNSSKQVPLWCQRAGQRAEGLIIWDYHVICIQIQRNGKGPCQVWDLDSTLPFPSPLAHYLSEAIRPSFQLYPEFQRFFRVVHAPIFLRFFASDRRHMKDSIGNWIAHPPAYEPIVSEDGVVHNLDEYIQLGAADATDIKDGLIHQILGEKLGVVVNESQLQDLFSLFP